MHFYKLKGNYLKILEYKSFPVFKSKIRNKILSQNLKIFISEPPEINFYPYESLCMDVLNFETANSNKKTKDAYHNLGNGR